MELCETCKKEKCNKKFIVTQQDDVTVITCLEYEKDKSKIQGYKKQVNRTARITKSVMGLYNPSWN